MPNLNPRTKWFFSSRCKLWRLPLIAAVLLTVPLHIQAQSFSQVSFRLDLSEEIANRIFNPVTDQVFLLGDHSPLSQEEGYQMQPSSEGTEIFAVTIDFSPEITGAELTYKFALQINGTRLEEPDSPPRRIVLTPGIKRLTPAEFGIEFQMFESRKYQFSPYLYVKN